MPTEPSDHRPALRSLLFVPGTKPGWVSSAISCGADGIILDLEDAVAAANKAAARATVAEIAARWEDPAALFVRVNALTRLDVVDELRAIVQPGLSGILVPKIASVEDIAVADRLLGWCEQNRGMPVGSVALIPLLETATALRDAFAIARAASRVAYLGALAARGGDIERAVGFRWTPEGLETLALRSRVLLDARAAGVANPVTGLWTNLADLDGLRRFAEQNRDIGYEGMLAIHPSHVPVINEVFSLDTETAEHYRRVIEAVETAQADGQGAITVDGVMVDEAMAATARRRLSHGSGNDTRS